MRIVSQDKEWDIPYKNAIIRRIDKDIYAYHPVITGGSKKIAKYSTKKKRCQSYGNAPMAISHYRKKTGI